VFVVVEVDVFVVMVVVFLEEDGKDLWVVEVFVSEEEDFVCVCVIGGWKHALLRYRRVGAPS